MYDSLLNLETWLASPWVVPAMGGIVCCSIVYLIGRRFLVAKPQHTSRNSEPLMDDGFLGTVTRDRRAAPRRKGNTVDVELRFDPNQQPIHGWVLDRSVGGLGVILEQPLTQGISVQVRPRASKDATTWIDATVRSCRRDGSQFEVGLQFHRTPNWSLMLQFG